MRIKKKDILLEERLKKSIPIPSEVLQLHDIFKRSGYELYVVGGAVRDSLLSKPIKDYDLATDAVPDVVEKILKKAKIRTIATGKSFGVINAYINDEEFEIATFREDSESSDGRRPDSVTFSDIETDVKRRDLTINALFYDIETKEIVDLVGGIDDINNKVIRTVGKADERFDEDRLRILRAIRFAARVNSPLDADIDRALIKNNSLIGANGKKISGERIMDEITKGIKSAVNPKQFMDLIDKYGLFNEVFPGISVNKNYLNSNNPIVVLAGLFRDEKYNSISKVLKGLKYGGEVGDNVSFLVNFQRNMSMDNFYDLKLIFKDKHIDGKSLQEFGDLVGLDRNITNKFITFNTTISGEDVMRDLKLEPGIKVRIAKSELEKELFIKTL